MAKDNEKTTATILGEHVWYLAYGSNMSREKFTGSRGIVPLATARVRVPGWRLAFNIPGLPYSEPTFTSIVPRPETVSTRGTHGSHAYDSTPLSRFPEETPVPDVLGIAYLLTAAQYVQVLASEGGGIAYTDIAVAAEPVSPRDEAITGGRIIVRTLGNVPSMVREPWPRPSRRYMGIVVSGAREVQMPEYWQKYLKGIAIYEPPSGKRQRAGATIFLAFWGPVMGLMEKITNATMRKDGYAPLWVRWLVRATMLLIWACHDLFFAPLCGRGDGREDGMKVKGDGRGIYERSSLLEAKDSRMYDA